MMRKRERMEESAYIMKESLYNGATPICILRGREPLNN